MNFENITSLNVEKVKTMSHHLVATKYEQLARVDFKHVVATSIESFITLKGIEKAKFLGFCLIGAWLVYVS